MDSSFVLYVLDTETTGLDKEKHEIIELSILRINDSAQKTWCIKPSNYDSIESEALRINGHKLEDLKHQTAFGRETYKAADKVIAEIENWMMEDCVSSSDRILVGQNPSFDVGFLQKFWSNLNSEDTFPFGKRPFIMDTRQIALLIDLALGTRREFYNLGSLASDFGVKKEKAHRADSDTRMTKELWEKQFDLISKGLKSLKK